MAAALGAGDRQAAARVYDVYGARLYSYAYELVADRARAVEVLRDALTVAAYRADELADPDSLGAWLFALVRVECERDGFAEDVAQDAASGIRGDRLARVALDCYALFSPERREVLDLAFRHRLVDDDIGRLLGVSLTEVSRRVAAAQDGIEYAMTAAFARTATACPTVGRWPRSAAPTTTSTVGASTPGSSRWFATVAAARSAPATCATRARCSTSRRCR